MASSDLGGLGAKDGPGLAYNWALPSIMPDLFPWVLLLLLLALKPNRSLSAWLIWLPLGTLLAIKFLIEAFGLANSYGLDPLQQVFLSMAFALAALWLVSPYLVRKFRVLTCLCLILSLGFFSELFYAIRELWQNDFAGDVVGIVISLLVLGVGLGLALVLSSLVCGRRHRPIRFSIWLVIWLLLGITVCASPFVLYAVLTNGVPVPLGQLLAGVATGILIAVGVNALLVLPFLLLSFRNAFFRERFKSLFHLTEPAVPPVAPPPIPAVSETEGA